MANGEINATDLTEETTSTLSGNEQFVMFDPVEGKRADIDEVAKYIAGDKTQLQTTDKNSLVGAINEVNGKAADLKEDINATDSDVLSIQKNLGVDVIYKNSVPHTSAISYNISKTSVSAEAGYEVSVKIEDAQNTTKSFLLYTKYVEDQSATNIATVAEDAEYTFISAKTLEFVGVYQTGLTSGTTIITATITNPNGIIQQMSEKVDKDGQAQVKTLNIKDVENNVLFSSDNIVVHGTTAYVYKDIYKYSGTLNVGDKFLLSAKSVVGATASSPFYCYVMNDDTVVRTRTYGDVEITQADINSGANSVKFQLYPATGTKLPTNYATFTGVTILKGVTKEFDIVGDLKEALQTFINGSYTGDVPDYYFNNNYLGTKINRINQLAEQCAGNGDIFLFITDEHYDFGYNQKHSPAIIDYLNKSCNIPRLFDGGDSANGASTEWIDMIHSGFSHPIHHVMGNHEWMLNRSGDYLAYYFDSFAFNQIGYADRHYYYVDNLQKKIRYIILNTWESDLNQSNVVISAYNAQQLNWFTNTALNVDLGWDIIIFTHFIKAGNNVSPSGALDFLNAIDNYDGNGEIICVFEGHTHYDCISHTTSGIPIINTTCDKNKSWISEGVNMEPWLDAQRPDGTIYEQAFDVCMVNRDTREITAVRVGALAMNNVDKTFGSDDFTTDGTLEERVISY